MPAVPAGVVVLAALILGAVRLLGLGVRAGAHPLQSGPALCVWSTIRVLDEARTWLFPLYSSQLTPGWLRLLGARIGKDVEASTALMIPSLVSVSDQAFLADDTLIGGYELGGGWLRAERVKVGKRAFVGNSAMAAPGRKVPKRSLVAVLSAAPARRAVKAGESWLGSPPAPLRRAAQGSADERTYAPPTRLKVARGCWEVARLVPVTLAVCLHLAVVLGTLAVWVRYGAVAGVLAVPLLLWGAGLLAAVVAVLAKWLLVGRVRAGSHPLWSSFVWRNELADTFVEVVATPWFAGLATGSPLITGWFRAMGRESDAACGASRTGCPSRTSSSSAPAQSSTRAASCRPTCSTTGCSPPTPSGCTAAPPWAPTRWCCRPRPWAGTLRSGRCRW